MSLAVAGAGVLRCQIPPAKPNPTIAICPGLGMRERDSGRQLTVVALRAGAKACSYFYGVEVGAQQSGALPTMESCTFVRVGVSRAFEMS